MPTNRINEAGGSIVAELDDRPYLPSMTVEEYLAHVAAHHPGLHALLDPGRLRSPEVSGRLSRTATEFDSDETGRGDSYRRAQRDPLVRWTGMEQLLGMVTGGRRSASVLDVLGGDGTVARAVHRHGLPYEVLTGDLSGPMIDGALDQGLPALRQSADALALRSDAVDGVLIAYGSHHIDPSRRLVAAREAVRVTRPGGCVVLHDFDPASPMARFFTDVVHPGTRTGHDYAHFTRAEMVELFAGRPVTASVHDLYDPLRVTAATPEAARAAMCRYVGDMYGVSAVLDASPRGGWDTLVDVFDHTRYLEGLDRPPAVEPRPAVHEERGGFVAVVPRMALVVRARKDER